MKCAVILPEGKYADEFYGYSHEEGPRLEFIEIAKHLNADVLSYTSAAAKRGWWFRTLFGRFKKVGSAINAALLAGNYQRLYITSEGVGLPLAILLTLMGWRGRITCVFHNMSWRSKKLVVRALGHKRFTAFITVNTIQANILKNTCRIPENKIISAFNWVDDKFFRPNAPAAMTSEPYFMACGAENRDYDTLARAAERVQGRFAVYGHGFRASNITARSAPHNLAYMPRVTYRDLRDAYAASAIVLVPLNDVDYAAGVTGIVEAMAAGRPIIVTASRGISDYIASFDPSVVVPAGDDAAMAAAIMDLSQDADAREKLAYHNRQFAEQHCSVDKYALMVKERMLAP